MLPAQPSRSLEHQISRSGPSAAAKLARERMKIRSSTWTEEATHYASEESGGGGSLGGSGGRYVVGGPRRRQPPIPFRPSSAGILMTPSGTAASGALHRPFAFASKGTVPPSAVALGYSTHPQPRRITPPVPLRARRKGAIGALHQQHSFHSDTGGAATSRAEEDDDDDDEDWC